MSFSLPGGVNSFLPQLQDNLLVSFSRNPKAYAVNRIAQIRPVTQMNGFYLYFDPLDEARFANGTAAPNDPFRWPEGSLRPKAEGGRRTYEFRQFTTSRFAYANSIGQLVNAQAAWPLLKKETEGLATDAMAARSLEVATLITTSANFAATHVATCTALAGGFASAGTETNPILMKALTELALIINKDCNGIIKPEYLTIVCNPNVAAKLSYTQELHSYLARSPYAAAGLTGDAKDGLNAAWNLPGKIYGFNLVVDDTTYNPFNRGASGEVQGYVYPDNQLSLITRESEFESVEGGTSVSTATLFVYGPDDMKAEAKTDEWNRLENISVVDNRQAKLTASVSGGIITNLFS